MAVEPLPITFEPAYQPGTQNMRCSGPAGCGALVTSKSAEQHVTWHNLLQEALSALLDMR